LERSDPFVSVEAGATRSAGSAGLAPAETFLDPPRTTVALRAAGIGHPLLVPGSRGYSAGRGRHTDRSIPDCLKSVVFNDVDPGSFVAGARCSTPVNF
jgi:hypothetical protein